MKLSEAVAIFLSQKRRTTRRSYESTLKNMVKFVGDKPLDGITIHHLAEYSNDIESRGYKSPYTWNKYVKTVRTFFNWCVNQGMIETSPASIMKTRRVQSRVPRDKAMPDKDLGRLLTYTQFNIRYHALILFLADTGCRAGGAAGLRTGDIDFDLREAVVTEKGDKTRNVLFGKATKAALKAWLDERPDDTGPFVFSPDGQQMLSSSISQIVRRCCERAGVKPRGSHSLRHRKGHQMADNKVAPSVAMVAMGHSDPSMTLDHYYPNDWDRARKALDELTVPMSEDDSKVMEFPRRKTK
jgi:integrase